MKKSKQIKLLRDALEGLIDRYTSLVCSGDCGNWDPESEEEVYHARQALEKTDPDGPMSPVET